MNFNFKNLEDYREQRQALLNEVQELINNGDIESSNTLMDKIPLMDSAYEDFAKAQANFNALNGITPPSKNIENGKVIDSMNNNINTVEDKFDSLEYRKAFMNYVLKGTQIPKEFLNVDQNTKTTDVGAAIPTTVLDKIIQKMESTGNILSLVTRTGYKGGVTIPVSAVKPTASWVAESTGSDKQKSTTGTINFAYHKLRCAVSVSLEVDTMAISAFETMLINNISEAMVKAVEQAIISGDGTGKPTGILTETPNDGQNIDLAAAPTYEDLCDAEGKLPLAYENGAVWFMTKTTFMKFLGMTDLQGQPIARVNYGIGGTPERSLLGRSVVLNDYMTSYSEAAEGIVAFLFRPEDYVLNTNLNITVKQYEDNDTDDFITKAVMLADGKVVDKNSLVTMTVKNS